eukprot:Nitzschia sp. Nitz4//scaffold116_size91068//45196//46393//NITZ4_004957-RA/size91068-augustus-gene-0.54-mRNA-1//1//CDS//3329533575//9117//frame0
MKLSALSLTLLVGSVSAFHVVTIPTGLVAKHSLKALHMEPTQAQQATSRASSVPTMESVASGTSRSEAITQMLFAGATAAFMLLPKALSAYNLPDLPYAYDALEPQIDAPTMKLHHDKHHATYVANVNKALEGQPEKPVLDVLANALDAGPAVRNNAGGHYNHAFFWNEMLPAAQAKNTKPSSELTRLINKSFGSFEEMKSAFEAKAAPGATFGSGWVWVVLNQAGDKLEIVNTPNQDSPLMKGVLNEVKFPILGLDVWEHAYYLNYQNRRPEYVSNWWSLVNWDKVSDNFAYVSKEKAGVPY